MKDWYTTREAEGLTHRSQKVAKGKLLYLTPKQAELINVKGEKVAKVDAPAKPDDVAVLADWDEFKKRSDPAPTAGARERATNPPEKESEEPKKSENESQTKREAKREARQKANS
ncbi:MAG: hypothetical protein AAFQ41_00360 [Cyanobacteria bacterium J06623_7]